MEKEGSTRTKPNGLSMCVLHKQIRFARSHSMRYYYADTITIHHGSANLSPHPYPIPPSRSAHLCWLLTPSSSSSSNKRERDGRGRNSWDRERDVAKSCDGRRNIFGHLLFFLSLCSEMRRSISRKWLFKVIFSDKKEEGTIERGWVRISQGGRKDMVKPFFFSREHLRTLPLLLLVCLSPSLSLA